jgi:hypothetical protein
MACGPLLEMHVVISFCVGRLEIFVELAKVLLFDINGDLVVIEMNSMHHYVGFFTLISFWFFHCALEFFGFLYCRNELVHKY